MSATAEMQFTTMSTTSYDSKIANSWSLLAFARANGRPKLANFVNSETKEPFKSLAFVDNLDNVTCLVGFSQNLGELTIPEIIARQHDLQVVQLESGKYKLCKKGENSWEDIALDL